MWRFARSASKVEVVSVVGGFRGMVSLGASGVRGGLCGMLGCYLPSWNWVLSICVYL